MKAATLAQRVGISAAESPLYWKLRRLSRRYASVGADTVETWLVDVANSRGAFVVRRKELPPGFSVPEDVLTIEELVVGLILPRLADEPQILRLAAQFVSRGRLDKERLLAIAKREGALRILRNIAEQALRTEPEHLVWRYIAQATTAVEPLRDNVLHWSPFG